MVKRIIVVTLVLFLLYTLFVHLFAPEWWKASQHQWQDNVIKAQKFIYDENDSIDHVVIGSSLSCRMLMDRLPRTYNLSFAGQGIYDGLRVLSLKGAAPKTVFIEMNFALRKENEDFTSSIKSPVLFYPKKVFLSLRENKQPLAIIGSRLNEGLVSKNMIRVKSFFHLSASNGSEIKQSKQQLFDKLLKLQVETYSKLPDQTLTDECFKLLEEHVTLLKRKGTKVVFFEMPVNDTLVSLPRARFLREQFELHFPRQENNYISLPDSSSWHTTDGVHLNTEEALKYTLYFRNRMSDFIK